MHSPDEFVPRSMFHVREPFGNKYQWFKCGAPTCKDGKNGGVKRYQHTGDRSSTTNLTKHATRCFGAAAVKAGRIDGEKNRDGSVHAMFARRGQRPATASFSTHTTAEARAHIVKWVTESNRAIRIVEDREFIELMTAGRPSLQLPGRKTVERDIAQAFKRARTRVIQLLKDYPGQFHIATDAWTSPNHRAFVAWTVHLQYDGTPLTFLLDIAEVPESHTGERLAAAFQNMLQDMGLEYKILAFTGDNATSNDTQVTELATLLNSFEEQCRVRCFNHTMQLSAKGLLKPFNSKRSSQTKDGDEPAPNPDLELFDLSEDEDEDGNDNDDVDIPDLETPDDDDAEGDDEEAEEALEELSEEDRQKLLEDTSEVRSSLAKIRGLSFAIINSTTIALPAWREACKRHSLKVRFIPRDVKTRWNSTYDMLVLAIQYRAAIDDVTADKSLKLRKHELDEDDWKILTDLKTVLKLYKEATIWFSQDSVCTITAVIPTMDRFDDYLSDAAETPVHPAVKAALAFARKIMDKYYSKSDLSEIYRIAMVLHPSLKLEYFKGKQWRKEWIEQSESITRDAYKEYVKNHSTDSTTGPPAGSEAPSTSNSTQASADHFDFSFFDNISMVKQAVRDELDEYLKTPLQAAKDPLQWWHANRHAYPILSRMALDYLSVPATSTAVERVFSQGRHLLHFTRNRLSPRSIRRLMCLGAWNRVDLIPLDDLKPQSVAKGKSKAAKA